MIWVWVLVGIGVAGLVMVGCYAVWLWHKVSDVLAEVSVVGDRLGQLGELLEGIDLAPLAEPGALGDPGDPDDPRPDGPGPGRNVRFDPDPYADDDLIAEREAVWPPSAVSARHAQGGSEE